MDRMTTAAAPVHYPESDGKPMGEPGVHIDALIYRCEALRDYFRADLRVYSVNDLGSVRHGVMPPTVEG